jgi:PAS domain-containing protein
MELSGHTREELIGQSSTALGIWADPAQRNDLIRQLETQGGARFEFQLRRKNDETADS